MINAKIVGMLAAALVAGSFVASPELRAYAANTVFSADIVDGEVKTPDLAANAVTAAKIKDNEVKAAEIAANAVGSSEIATDAVGGSELQGITKILFGHCVLTSIAYTQVQIPGGVVSAQCSISGVDSDDSAVATLNKSSDCFKVSKAVPASGLVYVLLRNDCPFNSSVGAGGTNGGEIGIIVFDK